MSPTDTDEIYEKLLQIYKDRYPHNPRHVLSYKISELVREGRTRENAILTLYEGEGKITRAEAEELGEAIRKKKEETIEQQIEEHNKSVEKLTLLFSKGEMSEESYRAAIKPHEEKIAKLEIEKKEEEVKSLEEKMAKLKREVKEEATVEPKRESVELGAPPPTSTKRLDLRTISKYFIHGFAFSILFSVMFILWIFIFAVLIVAGAIIGLIIGLGLLVLIVGYLNSEITGFLWFEVDQEFWNLLFHGGVLFVALLAVNAIIIWVPTTIFPSVGVQIITLIIGSFVDGVVGKEIAAIWQEED